MRFNVLHNLICQALLLSLAGSCLEKKLDQNEPTPNIWYAAFLAIGQLWLDITKNTKKKGVAGTSSSDCAQFIY